MVYSERRLALPGGGYRVVETPAPLSLPEKTRELVAGIPGLAWVSVRDRLYRGAPYFTRGQPAEGACFYIYYGHRDSEFTLQSSRLLVVRRNNGRVLYHGSANDEG